MPDWGPFSLTGKAAVVTGGAAGIGLGIVQGLLGAGAQVMAVGRRADGEAVIAREAPGASFLREDLADAEAPARVIVEAERRMGRLDILVNNAAMLDNLPLAEMDAAYIDAMSAVNIRAVLLLARHFAEARRRHGGGGKIVNVGSLEGYVATLPFGMAAYSATKTAIRGMTVTLARELAPLRIGVNGVAPGAIMHDNLATKSPAEGMTPERLGAALAQLTARTNTGRLGAPEDIAGVCVFLASRAADYVSGQVLVVDGGVTRT